MILDKVTFKKPKIIKGTVEASDITAGADTIEIPITEQPDTWNNFIFISQVRDSTGAIKTENLTVKYESGNVVLADTDSTLAENDTITIIGTLV